MDLNTRKERFSLAYVGAVAACAGYDIIEPRVDRDSVDGILISDFGLRPRIDFQAKATARDIARDGNVAYPLPVKNYDDLRADTRNPRILIVVLIPDHEDEWLRQSNDELCLRHCGYWLSLAGRPSVANTGSVTVHIPLSNVFGITQLADLMGRAELGETL